MTLRLELSDDVMDELVERVAARAVELFHDRLDVGPATQSEFLTVPETAELLRASRQRVYDLLSDGRLTRFKDGSRVLVARTEIEAHLAGGANGGVAHALPSSPRARAGRRAPR